MKNATLGFMMTLGLPFVVLGVVVGLIAYCTLIGYRMTVVAVAWSAS